MAVTACIFDAYGTLFDVTAAARTAAGEPGRGDLAAVWERLAADWRAKQLEYSWLRAVTGDYVPFWEVTKDGLDWAMERAGLDDLELRERLLALYWELAAYREAPRCLAELKAAGRATAILSNGSPDMLDGAVASSGIGEWLDAVLSVDAVGVFKPARAVYNMVGARFGTDPGDVLFVSSNGWDIAGAAAYGFHTVWVNRAGLPVDRLPGRPAHMVDDLSTVPSLAATL
ncbi:MAG: haloacid dehalogenase type II [Paracoccaceae bacterium]|nr:haloacid dehalogenase type II [Paracoccaceae bacterium]